MKSSGRELSYQVGITAAIALISVTAFFPLYYVLVMSFVSETEWVQKGGILLWVNRPILNGYSTVLRNLTVIRTFLLSVARTVSGTALGVFWSMILGYGVSRRDMRGRKPLIVFVLVTFLFGGGLIPTYLVIWYTHIYNTFLALIIPGMVGAWNVLVFKQFFEGIPREIEESADIDGATQSQVAFSIVFPMSKPVIAALSLFIAVGLWNDWFGALVFTRDPNLRPFMLYLQNMFDVMNPMAGGQLLLDPSVRATPTGVKIAVTVIGIVPIMCVYPFLQKYFIKGVYTGSVKG
jgi:putative aldouronate transport system permease protein